jgi:hypothetical protein
MRMEVAVKYLFVCIYLAIAIPLCILVMIFWLIRLVITIGLMVFVMLLEAWRTKGVSERPMAIINSVLRVGPDTVKTILAVPFAAAPPAQGDTGREMLYEVGHTFVFLALLVTILFFQGYIGDVGRALTVPRGVYAGDGLIAKLGVGYVLISCGTLAFLLFQDRMADGIMKHVVIPINLILSGLLLAVLLANAVQHLQ